MRSAAIDRPAVSGTPRLPIGPAATVRKKTKRSFAAMIAALAAREAALASPDFGQKMPMRTAFAQQLCSSLDAHIVAVKQHTLWNTVSAVMPEVDCRQRWVVKMDKLGFAVSTGSACASGKERPSHVLSAMGFSPALAGRVLRFSSGWETTESDWMQLLEGVIQVSEELARLPGQPASI